MRYGLRSPEKIFKWGGKFQKKVIFFLRFVVMVHSCNSQPKKNWGDNAIVLKFYWRFTNDDFILFYIVATLNLRPFLAQKCGEHEKRSSLSIRVQNLYFPLKFKAKPEKIIISNQCPKISFVLNLRWKLKKLVEVWYFGRVSKLFGANLNQYFCICPLIPSFLKKCRKKFKTGKKAGGKLTLPPPRFRRLWTAYSQNTLLVVFIKISYSIVISSGRNSCVKVLVTISRHLSSHSPSLAQSTIIAVTKQRIFREKK